MTFLKKLGQIIASGLSLATSLGPIALPFLGGGKSQQIAGTVLNDMTQLTSVVTSVEACMQTPGSGAAKLAAATPLALSILKTSQAFDGKKIANESLAEQGASKIVSGLADFMNSLHEDEAKTGG